MNEAVWQGRPDFIPRELFRVPLSAGKLNKLFRAGKNQASTYVYRCREQGRPIKDVNGWHRPLDVISRARADCIDIRPPLDLELKQSIEELKCELKQLQGQVGNARHSLEVQSASSVLTKATLLNEEEIVAGKMDLPVRSGVYFLIRHFEVVYVGQSINVFGRIGQHAASKEFDSFSFIPAHPLELDVLESLYIHTLHPPLNAKRNSGHSAAPLRLDEILNQARRPLAQIKEVNDGTRNNPYP